MAAAAGVSRRLTVIEPFHSPFYAPLWAAVALGHFVAEGLDVQVATAARSGGTVTALLAGEADVALGGIMRSLELADRGGGLLPHFAEVNSRNGFFLLGRTPAPGFRWADLAGRTVVSFAEAPTPWQCMLTVLRRHGVDPAAVKIVRDRPVADAVAAFLAGDGDYLEQAQPVTETLLAAGRAHLVASMGEATGPVPFSSYMTTPALLAREPDTLARFVRAAYRTQRWMLAQPVTEIAGAIASAYADVPPAVLAALVDRYRRQGTWPADPILRREGFETLQQILLDGGFIARRHRYEDLVDTRIAGDVVGRGA